MHEDNGNGYKLTCTNEKTVDETGSPQKRELAYKLTTKGFGLLGLDQTGSSLGWHPSVGLSRAWCVACLGAVPFAGAGWSSASRRREGKEKEGREKREERDPGEEEKGERKKRKKHWVLGIFGGQNPNI